MFPVESADFIFFLYISTGF